MRHPVIGMIGYALVGLILIGLALTVVMAAVANQPFYGVNYKGLALGTYSTLFILVVAAAVRMAKLILAWRRRYRR